MTTLGKRLKQAMGNDTNRSKVAAAGEVSVQRIGQVLKEQSDSMSGYSLAKIERHLNVNLLWLCTGEGSMTDATGTPRGDDLEAMRRVLARIPKDRIEMAATVLAGWARERGAERYRDAFIAAAGLTGIAKQAASAEQSGYVRARWSPTARLILKDLGIGNEQEGKAQMKRITRAIKALDLAWCQPQVGAEQPSEEALLAAALES